MKKDKLPNILMLQRKSVRMFINDIAVGLYYSKELDKYFTISTAHNDGESVSGVREEQEDERSEIDNDKDNS